MMGFNSDTISADTGKDLLIELRLVSTSEILVEEDNSSNTISKDVVKTEVLSQN